MSSPAPGLPALPAAPGSAEWVEMRAAYVRDKERLLQEQHAEASRQNRSPARPVPRTACVCHAADSHAISLFHIALVWDDTV